MPNDHTFVVDVEATVEVRDANVAPTLIFSFPGLADPRQLWVELAALDWDIPERPAHPDPEIDWNAPTGQGYAILPYQVDGFVVTARNWPTHEVAERGLTTINLLRRLGVDLTVPVHYLDFLRRTQVEILRDPTRNQPVSNPTQIPTTLFLTKQPWSALVDNPDINVYETAAGPSQPNWYWAESQSPSAELFDDVDDRSNLLRTLGMGWELVNRMEAPRAVDGRDRILRFVVSDVRDGTAMLDQLKDTVGDECASLLMRPINTTGAVANCLLIVAVVPNDRFSEIGQGLISNFSDAIGRGRRYVPASEDGVE